MMVEERNFVEQAEYIPKEEFLDLSSDHPNEKEIIKKLSQSGAKLITGPRGCGKTTLIFKAYYKLIDDDGSVLPIYVNYKTSLKLEPNYKKNSNGTYMFALWMYLKILKGLITSVEELNLNYNSFKYDINKVNDFLDLIELGEGSSQKVSDIELSISDVQHSIHEVISFTKKKRCVIFFDDAAHAFSPEQQADFFELFRKIKDKIISPKAAIYPGITNFSPSFNVGHDAEQINVWINPEDSDYTQFMISLLRKRLIPEVFDEIVKDKYQLYILCFACFGLPRQLLNMVRNFYSLENGKVSIKFSRKNLMNEIRSTYKSTVDVFQSLETKMPIYKNYISEGNVVYERLLELIYNYNKSKEIHRKSIVIAVKKPLNGDLKKIFGFYQYAGLLSHKDQVSRGEKGTFERYIINIAALIDRNAILTTKAFNSHDLASALIERNAHEFTRSNSNVILSNSKESISITLPACQNCGKERLNQEAKFCYNCGAPLKVASIYEQLVDDDISKLKLTDKRAATIKKESSIRTVKDIITDIGSKELKSVYGVGEYWTKKIKQLAEEYIS